MAQLLIVDDDPEILSLLGQYLSQHGFDVATAGDGAHMWQRLAETTPDLIILDVMLPNESGLSLCQKLQRERRIPVIMLTAMGELSDRVIGLELGADDYLAKPFDARELLARVRSVLRRNALPPGEQLLPTIRFAGWCLDIARRELRSPDNVMIPLSSGEFDLLQVFIEHPQRVLTREQLLDLARGHHHDAYDRSVDVQISRLRRKLEADSKRPEMIRTVRNGGYVFTPGVTRR